MATETYNVGSFNYKAAVFGESLTRDRYKTPRSLRDRGIYLEYPYRRESDVSQSSRMLLRSYATNRSVGRYVFAPQLSYSVVGSDVPPIEAELISKLADKWRNTDANLGLILSPEGRESVQMMGDLILKLGNAAVHLRRGDFGGFVRNLDHLPRGSKRASARRFNQGDISGAFLAAHLGWEPMLKDVYALSHIKPPVEKGQRIYASKAGTPAKWTYTVGSYYGDVLPVEKSEVFRCKYLGDIVRPPSFTERFGLDNPFLVAWNLVPLSFVADYFLPIGSVIDSMGFISAARFSKLWRKEYRSRSFLARYSRDFRIWDSTGPIYCEGIVLRKQTKYTRKIVELNFASPLRSMKVSLPSSIMRLATISSLTHQRLLALGHN